MNNEQLNIIACNSSAQVIDAIFDNDGKFEIAKHDVLEFTPSGYFKNYNHPERIFWPQNSLPYNQESLYIVDSVKQADKKYEVTLNKWDFGGPTIIGNTEQTCNIVIPTYRLIEVTKKYGFKETEQALEWFKKEFLFQTTENSYLFFRILSNTSNLEGGWLGCNYVANIESKKVDGKEYLFVSNLKKSPQKKLNVQKGIAHIRFVSEQEAIVSDPILNAQLAKQAADPNSIINLWEKYNQVDAQMLEDYKIQSGILRIEKITAKGENCSATLQNKSEEIENFKNIYDQLNANQKNSYSIYVFSKRKSYNICDERIDEKTRTVSWKWGERKPKYDNSEKLELEGFAIDFKPWSIASKRRTAALENIRTRNIPIASITDILNKTTLPSFGSAAVPKRLNDLKIEAAFGNRRPNEAQKRALKVCLNTPDIALIQGPPGTGKTSVINALQKYLQSIDPKHPEKMPSILLTSFQHVAVDNVADGSSIWGLPVFRFYGEQKDKEQIFRGLQKWQEDTAKKIDEQINKLQSDTQYIEYEKLQISLNALSAASSSYEIRNLLQEIINLAVTNSILSPSEVDTLKEFKKKFQVKQINNKFYQCLMGLRTTSTGFNDDGKRMIEHVLEYYDLRKDSLNCYALEKGYDQLKKLANSTPSQEDLDWVEELRNKCIEQMVPNPTDSFDNQLFTILKDYIDTTIEPNIRERIRQTDLQKLIVLNSYKENVGFKSIRNAMLRYAMTYAATVQQSKSESFVRLLGKKNFEFDYVIIDEAARANPLDLFIPITLARKKVILVGDHKQLPQLVDQDILEQMECSNDSRERFEELKGFMEKSLFESLWDYLKTERNDGIVRTVTLDTQYRMPQKLSDFVSRNFYGDETHIQTGKNPNDCIHHVSRYTKKNGDCKCAVWENVDSKESGKISKTNEAEAELIIKRIKEIIKETDETIGVIASYSAQTRLIDKIAKSDAELKKKIDNKHLEIGSIDAFQGRQFDIVFFSVVRSNDRNNFGFLKSENRLNVAFSRQKKLLVIVGNRKMYETEKAQEEVPALKEFIKLADEEK
ncbi:conserved domain protein [Fibrobacter succinogenes subsp. succinogenes S85]|uniref:Conserved domain protein n=1 Tax=Fibrobacter succinogenes (strain ATCC 19169 / S85) TaxID=59374 RepID=C9RK43_FIBSS|nr:ATP-binding protein [Fibrobacter succinogenes]ACX75776.1 Superfamily I DNA and RNA helicase and helicase subunits-like protein [Fibrobacter succinogenes subsp. succinogenes S85]ADL27211.1 conserved domain protein [Fibrobacter succinogenes subsp. succinogenes S85]